MSHPDQPSVNIHASCVRLAAAGASFGAPADAGILLLGPSGSGKSGLALQMIAAGAELVADDRVELFCDRGKLSARPPGNLAGMIELYGAGIAALPHAPKAMIALAVSLGESEIIRLPAPRYYTPPAALGLAPRDYPPLIALDAFAAVTPAKIAAAAAAYAHGLFRDSAR